MSINKYIAHNQQNIRVAIEDKISCVMRLDAFLSKFISIIIQIYQC